MDAQCTSGRACRQGAHPRAPESPPCRWPWTPSPSARAKGARGGAQCARSSGGGEARELRAGASQNTSGLLGWQAARRGVADLPRGPTRPHRLVVQEQHLHALNAAGPPLGRNHLVDVVPDCLDHVRLVRAWARAGAPSPGRSSSSVRHAGCRRAWDASEARARGQCGRRAANASCLAP